MLFSPHISKLFLERLTPIVATNIWRKNQATVQHVHKASFSWLLVSNNMHFYFYFW